MIKIAPSILSADHGQLAEEIKAMEEAGADYIHIDIMDGCFVPNLSFGPWVVSLARKITKLPLDVHLMVSDPLTYGPVFAKEGASIISIHVEATCHLNRCLESIRAAGALSGAVLNPATPLETLNYSLAYTDLILLMGVNPGFGGQKFIPETLEKVSDLTKLLKSKGRNIPIEIDGGVSDINSGPLAKAGANILVSGSHLFKSSNYQQAIQKMKEKVAAAA